jgi:hypothetical protein
MSRSCFVACFPWLRVGSEEFQPYCTIPTTYRVPCWDPRAERRTLPQKLEGLVQQAYAQADQEAGHRLSAVLVNVHRRVALDTRPGGGQVPANSP